MKDGGPFVAKDILNGTICPHLAISRCVPRETATGKKFAGDRIQGDDILPNGADEAAAKQGSCGFCPTDFCTWMTAKSLTIAVWKDLGNGKSFLDPSWQAMVTHRSGVMDWPRVRLFRKMNTIRDAYEGLPTIWLGIEHDPACKAWLDEWARKLAEQH